MLSSWCGLESSRRYTTVFKKKPFPPFVPHNQAVLLTMCEKSWQLVCSCKIATIPTQIRSLKMFLGHWRTSWPWSSPTMCFRLFLSANKQPNTCRTFSLWDKCKLLCYQSTRVRLQYHFKHSTQRPLIRRRRSTRGLEGIQKTVDFCSNNQACGRRAARTQPCWCIKHYFPTSKLLTDAVRVCNSRFNVRHEKNTTLIKMQWSQTQIWIWVNFPPGVVIRGWQRSWCVTSKKACSNPPTEALQYQGPLLRLRCCCFVLDLQTLRIPLLSPPPPPPRLPRQPHAARGHHSTDTWTALHRCQKG